MWKSAKHNFTRGVEKIRWLASLISDRTKIEFAVMKLLYQSEQLEEKRNALLKKVGERVYELREQNDRQILKDTSVTDAIEEIAQIDAAMETTRQKASEISSIDS
jgi:hypothetical protein